MPIKVSTTKVRCIAAVSAVEVDYLTNSSSGITAAKAVKAGAAKIYNMNGVELSAPQKGLNIIKTAEGTKKILK